MIQIENEKIIINGKSTLLFGGELHYFRVPKEQWRNRIRQVKAAGTNMISTYVPWIFHEIEEGNIDLTGRTMDERDLKGFLEIVAEEDMYCLVRPGPYVMAEIVDHGVPTWFIDNYPAAVAVTNKGDIHPTRVVSYMHPVFLEKAENWYQAVCEVIEPFQATHGGPVVLFQIDNEVGMFHWVTNQPDYNPVTLSLFKNYLANKYSKGEFEETFRTPYEDIDELALFSIKKPEPKYAHPLRNEFGQFFREHYRQFLEVLKQSAEKKGINIPFVVNIHGFHSIDLLKRGTMYPIGISQLLEAAKIENVLIAGDYYIGNIEYDNYIDIVLANAFTKAIQWKEQPLFSAEFQGGNSHALPRLQPTTFDLTTRLCMADGMNGVNYYMFAGGENYENIGLLGRRHDWQAPLSSNGEKLPHYYVIQHLGKMFEVFSQQLLETKPVYDTYLGFYPDYYMTEFYDEHTKLMVDEIHNYRDKYLYNGIAKGLRLNNVIFEAVNVMDSKELDPETIPVLWMFATKWMDAEIQQKLVNYLENGGRLVLFPIIPDRTMKNTPCSILKEYIGVNVKEEKEGGFATIGSFDSVMVNSMQTYDAQEQAFGWTEDNSKDPVAFEKDLGKGKLIMLGTGFDLDFDYKKTLVGELAEKAGIKKRFKVAADLDITVREGSVGEQFFFIENFDEYVKETTVQYRGEALFGGKKLKINPKSGLMLPVKTPLTNELMIVYGTGEIWMVENHEDKLLVTFKVTQKEEEFIFDSGTWLAEECDAIQVNVIDRNKYQVKIRSMEDAAVITFKKRN